MTVTSELLAELETVAKCFRITTDQAAELRKPDGIARDVSATEETGEEVTVTWQRASNRVPSVLVTVPAGEDRWAIPVPHRPDWLIEIITKQAPEWWLKK